MAFSEPTQDILVSGDNLLSFTANEDVTRGQVVKVAGSDLEVQPSDTDGETTHYVALQTVSSGNEVVCAGPGCEVFFTAGTSSISRGDPVTSHGGNGNEGEVDTASATGDEIIGYVQEAASSSGDLLRGELDRGGQIN